VTERRRTLVLMALFPGVPTVALCALLVIVAPGWPMVGAALAITAAVAVATGCGFVIVGSRSEHVERLGYPGIDTVEVRFSHYMLVLGATIIALAIIGVVLTAVLALVT
jgi:hypothetical protein